MSTLILQYPPGRTSLCPVEQEIVRIGRHPSNDIVIDEIYVSGFHAEVHRLPGGRHELVDLDSFNGTFINGQRVQRAELNDGDAVAFAVTYGKFRLHPGQSAESAGHAWSAAVRERGPGGEGAPSFPLPAMQPAPYPGPGGPPPPAATPFELPAPTPAPLRPPSPPNGAPSQFGTGIVLRFEEESRGQDGDQNGADGTQMFTEM